jgi:hypothetical protein
LVKIYNTRRPTIVLIKNIGTPIFGEQLVTKFASCFVILALGNGAIERLSKVHHKKIESQDFVTNF